jgi:hypothetical protein
MDEEQVLVRPVAGAPTFEDFLIGDFLPIPASVTRIERRQIEAFELEIPPLNRRRGSDLLPRELEYLTQLRSEKPDPEEDQHGPREPRQSLRQLCDLFHSYQLRR